MEQLEPGSAVYNICRASRLTGQLNIAALESSLAEILRRHEILRSQIRIVDGRPVQVAVAVPRFEVPVIDLRSLTEPEREREVRDRIKAEAERQFDFSAGLFLRAVLLQISNDQHILILTTHHIVADAWSMGILTRGTLDTLRCICERKTFAFTGAACPVCGLRGLATRVAARGRAGIPTVLLEGSSLRNFPFLIFPPITPGRRSRVFAAQGNRYRCQSL